MLDTTHGTFVRLVGTVLLRLELCSKLKPA